MRCPKCHYISFDAGDRCRNCGYEFAFSADLGALDLPIQTGDEPLGPLADLALSDPGARHASQAQPRAAPALELPLFNDRDADDRPLVAPPAVPRPPLAVRKSTPAFVRPVRRAHLEEAVLDLGPGEVIEPRPAPRFAVERSVARERKTDVPALPAGTEPADRTAPLGRRLAAGVIDLALLTMVDVSILYFTLRLCGLELVDVGLIPPIPFLSFLLLQNGGYFVAFVAVGGQTPGKMACGLKVVPAASHDGTGGVPLGAAIVRAAAWFLTVLPAGLGLLPALFSADHLTAHDRLAGTRVIRV